MKQYFILLLFIFFISLTVNASDDNLIFYEAFDTLNSIALNNGNISNSLTFSEGLFNSSVFFNGSSVCYKLNSSELDTAGSVEFYVKPMSNDWSGFIELYDVSTSSSFMIFKNDKIFSEFSNIAHNYYQSVSTFGLNNDFRWHFVSLTWETYSGEKHFQICVDGKCRNNLVAVGNFSIYSGQTLCVGETRYYGTAKAYIDELKVYSVPHYDQYLIKQYDKIGEQEKVRKDAKNCSMSKPQSLGQVKINCSGLFVNNTKFTIKGVGYQPMPIGKDAQNVLDRQEMFGTPAIYRDRDFPLLRKMSANTVRIWSEVMNKTFLDAAYNNGINPIYVVMGFWINCNENWSDDTTRNSYITRFTNYVNEYKDHPGVLMWALGNENNLDGCSPTKELYALLNDLAKTAYEIEGDKYHPVGIINGELGKLGNDTYLTTDIDLNYTDYWGINVYGGLSFADFFDRYSLLSGKPLYISEYGADSYDYFSDISTAPAKYIFRQYLELNSFPRIIGSTVMEYSDEWWKGGNSSTQETTGYSSDNQPDLFSNEEYYGIVKISKNGTGIDIVEPRYTYYVLRDLFRGFNNPPDYEITNSNFYARPYETIKLNLTPFDKDNDTVLVTYHYPFNSSGECLLYPFSTATHKENVLAATISDGTLSKDIYVNLTSYEEFILISDIYKSTYNQIKQFAVLNKLPYNWYTKTDSGKYISPEEIGFLMLVHIGAGKMSIISEDTASQYVYDLVRKVKVMPTYKHITKTLFEIGTNDAPTDYSSDAFDEFDNDGVYDTDFIVGSDPVMHFPKELNDGTVPKITITFNNSVNPGYSEDFILLLDTLYATHDSVLYYDINVSINNNFVGTYRFGSALYPEEQFIVIPKNLVLTGTNNISLVNANAPYSNHWLLFDSIKFGVGTNKSYYYRYYDSTTEQISDRSVPSIGNAMLLSSLYTAREWAKTQNYSDIVSEIDSIKLEMNLGLFYDPVAKLFYHDLSKNNHWNFYSDEGRLISFMAMANKDVNYKQFYDNLVSLNRTDLYFDLDTEKSTVNATNGILVKDASWDGSMFSYLVPSLFINETDTDYYTDTINPAVLSQIKYADKLGLDAFGFSDSMNYTGDYYCSAYQGSPPTVANFLYNVKYTDCEYVVAPYASSLALNSDYSGKAIKNLVILYDKGMFNDTNGFYDSMNIKTNEISNRFVLLDQEWILLSILNYEYRLIQNYFYLNDEVKTTHKFMYDVTPPQNIKNLKIENITSSSCDIIFESPTDVDFSENIFYLNDLNIINTSKNAYKFSGLKPNSIYNLSVLTKDYFGNINYMPYNSEFITLSDNSMINCTFDIQCGEPNYIGSLFCLGKGVSQEFKNYTCINPGTAESYCQEYFVNITNATCSDYCVNGECALFNCSSDSQCGQEIISDFFCSGKDILQTFTSYTCLNPGTTESYCSLSYQNVTKSTCTDYCINGTCKAGICSSDKDCGLDGFIEQSYCSSGAVSQKYRTYTCISPGTDYAKCEYNDEVRAVESCQYTCLNGKCYSEKDYTVIEYNLTKGYNMINVPFIDFNITSLTNLNSFKALYVWKDSKYNSLIKLNDSLIGAITEIRPNEGFFIKLNASEKINITGIRSKENNLNLSKGFNLVGMASQNITNITEFMRANENIVAVYKFNSGGYESFVKSQGNILKKDGVLDLFELGKGYFIKLRENSMLGAKAGPPPIN